ncbi:hypothetical protein PFICI_03950 [Pestalotiopsis fici W106-1]|uniref:Major facilitator superfamily (MFS) profile domain-containing protein n=1 Tax=Pestalotiopsis fici (strain W106-1 / CGMCC3.15140) TaxID=1229662 RepID=W3XIT0_PESFW|nr:uncharacterized protein PFICI_03950 [Pestalotiopsis fici W106-1]ETS85925.1 hypothetical protein PFICI_03950 [Pestalotiopsis fici W106-1]
MSAANSHNQEISRVQVLGETRHDEIELSRELPLFSGNIEAGVPTQERLEGALPYSQHVQPELDDQSSRLPFRRLILAYSCLAAIYFIQSLDINAVATALPVVSRALGAGNSITWTATAYLMGQTAFQPLYGRLSDIFGRKPVLMTCIGFVIVGDILCGFAQNVIWLYISRALSGVGGGGISSLVQIVVSDLVSLKARGKYQGIISGTIGLGACTGPFIAARMIGSSNQDNTSDHGWRWIFWIPPILAAVCMAMMWVFLPLKPVQGNWKEKIAKIDWYGLGAAVVAVSLLLIPINSGGSIWPWNGSLVITLLSIGGVFVVIFAIIEKRIAKIPLIPLRLFSQASTAILIITSGVYNLVWQVDIYFLPIYFQDVRGFSPLQSATLVLPLLLLQSVAGALSGVLMTKCGRYGPVMYPGMALWVLGAGLKVIFSRTTPVWVYVVVLFLEGAGIGFVLQPALVALQVLCKPEDRAVCTSTRNLLRMLGSVIGMAVSTAVQSAVTIASVPEDVPPEFRSQVADGTWQQGSGWDSQILDAKMKGVRAVFILLVPLMGICLLGCCLVPDRRLRGDEKIAEAPKRPGSKT